MSGAEIAVPVVGLLANVTYMVWKMYHDTEYRRTFQPVPFERTRDSPNVGYSALYANSAVSLVNTSASNVTYHEEAARVYGLMIRDYMRELPNDFAWYRKEVNERLRRSSYLSSVSFDELNQLNVFTPSEIATIITMSSYRALDFYKQILKGGDLQKKYKDATILELLDVAMLQQASVEGEVFVRWVTWSMERVLSAKSLSDFVQGVDYTKDSDFLEMKETLQKYASIGNEELVKHVLLLYEFIVCSCCILSSIESGNNDVFGLRNLVKEGHGLKVITSNAGDGDQVVAISEIEITRENHEGRRAFMKGLSASANESASLASSAGALDAEAKLLGIDVIKSNLQPCIKTKIFTNFHLLSMGRWRLFLDMCTQRRIADSQTDGDSTSAVTPSVNSYDARSAYMFTTVNYTNVLFQLLLNYDLPSRSSLTVFELLQGCQAILGTKPNALALQVLELIKVSKGSIDPKATVLGMQQCRINDAKLVEDYVRIDSLAENLCLDYFEKKTRVLECVFAYSDCTAFLHRAAYKTGQKNLGFYYQLHHKFSKGVCIVDIRKGSELRKTHLKTLRDEFERKRKNRLGAKFCRLLKLPSKRQNNGSISKKELRRLQSSESLVKSSNEFFRCRRELLGNERKVVNVVRTNGLTRMDIVVDPSKEKEEGGSVYLWVSYIAENPALSEIEGVVKDFVLAGDQIAHAGSGIDVGVTTPATAGEMVQRS